SAGGAAFARDDREPDPNAAEPPPSGAGSGVESARSRSPEALQLSGRVGARKGRGFPRFGRTLRLEPKRLKHRECARFEFQRRSREMKAIDIVYRYEERADPKRAHPLDAAAAQCRLQDGNRSFAALFDGTPEHGGVPHRVVLADSRDLGLLRAGDGAPKQQPF